MVDLENIVLSFKVIMKEVTESLYKLNCYINNLDGSLYNVKWRLNQGRIDTTELYEDRLKISDMGTFPLFPNEML